jgi:hypothetical protein
MYGNGNKLFTMEQKNNALKTIGLTQGQSRRNLEDHFNMALTLASKIYQRIPQGKWKMFFDETIKFGIGTRTDPSFVFLYQSNRIRAVGKLIVKKNILQKFLERNFNLLIEALLYPFYEYPATEAEAVKHTLSVEIPAEFSFTEEEFQELQQAFADDIVVTKKQGDSSDRDNQQGRVVFFTFKFCTKK